MRQRILGFSLLEVLVAFVILALALGALMRIFSGSLNNIGASARYSQALAVADSKLSAVDVSSTLEPGETAGVDEQGNSWRITVKPYQDTAPGPESLAKPLELYELEVIVSWQGALSKPRELKLTTLRTKARP